MSKVFIHRGNWNTIPSDSSPGLLFLKEFLPELDSLTATSERPKLRSLLTTDASFIINGGNPTPSQDVFNMFDQRAKMLSEFRHEVDTAWDIVADERSGSRTVIYESTSVTVFKHDPRQTEIRVREFNVVELVPSTTGAGFEGMQARELRGVLDSSPVTAAARSLSGL